MLEDLNKHRFLFRELVKRDFKRKYKRTALGIVWSVLSPLKTLLIMNLIFSHFFSREIEHYIIYLFCGNLLFAYFRESTTSGMGALMANASVFSKIRLPKYMFLLSKNVSSLVNFLITLVIFFFFVWWEGISFKPCFFALIYPVCCLIVFNIGVGMILSAMYVFFRDTAYLYQILTRLLMYMSAIFYNADRIPYPYCDLFLLNPVFCYIKYFRTIVLHGEIPSMGLHGLCGLYAILFLMAGIMVFKANNYKFLYYI